MKNFLTRLLLIFAILGLTTACALAQSAIPRTGNSKFEDNTYRTLTVNYISVSTTSTTAVAYQKPNAFKTLIAATLTHNLLDSLSILHAYLGDEVEFVFTSDTLSTGRVVTFGNNILANGSLTISKSSTASVVFAFNGVLWYELTRNSSSPPIKNRTATTYTVTGAITATAAQVNGGLLVAATATAATTITLPTTALLATQLNAAAGTTFDFYLLNNGGTNGTVTVAVGAGMTASGFPGTNTLTLAGSATVGVAGFRITFLSASASTLTRIN